MRIAVVLFCTLIQWGMAAKIDKEKAMSQLKKYGYMGTGSPLLGALTDETAYPKALEEYQWNMGLTPTGELDENTINIMVKPRCGVKDVKNITDIARRRKRYALAGGKWSTTPVSYREFSYTTNLPETTIRRVFDEALQQWSNVANIDFQRKQSGNVDLELSFARHEHADGNPFDGQSGTLAHAYFPFRGSAIEGDAHFDDDETWTDKTFQGTNLYQVAVHELGHSLGLSHSRDRNAIMYPSYMGYKENFRLGIDDVTGIQQIYGRRAGATNPPTPAPSTTRAPARTNTPRRTTSRRPLPTSTTTVRPGISDRQRFCDWNSFDGIDMINGMTYAFKHDLYVKLDESGIAPGYPRRIADDFRGAPSDVDAVLHWENDDRTFIFKGSYYWRYSTKGDSFVLNRGYPQRISGGFEGIPDDIDFAMVWGANGKTYFFKATNYYRYERSRGVPEYYPRSAELWDGLPFKGDGVNAAFKWKNKGTYFFSGGSYFRFDDWNFEVDKKANPPYPRRLRTWWLNCPGAQHANMEMDNHDDGMHKARGTGDLVTGSDDGHSAAAPPRASSVTLSVVFVMVLWVISGLTGQ